MVCLSLEASGNRGLHGTEETGAGVSLLVHMSEGECVPQETVCCPSDSLSQLGQFHLIGFIG